MGQRGDDLTVGTRRHGCDVGPPYEMGRKDECHQTSTWSSCSAVQNECVGIVGQVVYERKELQSSIAS
uniref:Uncharacterized protein n=1 Tax=Hyaloperonospora arabidopsidis (strain Emoy2) TaxID=559515 RepID=M4C2C8_HYAAE